MTDALVIQDLRKVYASGVEALRGIDLTVEEIGRASCRERVSLQV